MLAVSQMQGIGFENTFNSYGGTKKEKGDRKLREDIEILLRQEKYKFFPDPEFGTDIYKYLFEPLTPALGELIRGEVFDTITKYYPDLILNAVDVTLSDSAIYISVSIKFTETGQAENIEVIFEREER